MQAERSASAADTLGRASAADTLGLREQRKLRTRSELIRCTLELVERDGYGNVSVDDIVDAANVSRATFFNYFDGKAEPLFYDESESLHGLAEFIANRSDPSRSLAALTEPFVQFAARYGEQVADSRRRIRFILNSRELEDRSLRARFRLSAAVARELADERHAEKPSFDERLLGDISIACFIVALRRWEKTLTRTLPDLTNEAFERSGLFVTGAVKPTRARHYKASKGSNS